MPRLLLLLAAGVGGVLAGCGASGTGQGRTITIRPMTVQGHTITKVVIPPNVETGP